MRSYTRQAVPKSNRKLIRTSPPLSAPKSLDERAYLFELVFWAISLDESKNIV
jgi:hypothetical protein